MGMDAARLWRFLPTVHADSAPLSAVGVDLTPLPDKVPPIRMVRETVDIHLFATVAVVQAHFELANRGAARTLEVGFPRLSGGSMFTPPSAELMDIAVAVDGREVESTEKRIANEVFPFWRVWPQRFEAGATSRLDVRYWVPLVGYSGCSRIPFYYVLRTGRFWDGPIGEAVVTVHAVGIPLDAIVEALPAGAVRDADARRLQWRFENLVPEADIQLLISPFAVYAARLGLPYKDPHDLQRERPPAGTEVVVGGHIRTWDASDRLHSERCRDMNVAIPDGMRVHEDDDPALSLRLRRSPDEVVAMVPFEDFRGWRGCSFVHGRVEYEGEEAILAVTQIDELVPKGPLRFSAPGFPWVSGEWLPPMPADRISWPRFVTQHPLDRLRGKVHEPNPMRRGDPGERWPVAVNWSIAIAVWLTIASVLIAWCLR